MLVLHTTWTDGSLWLWAEQPADDETLTNPTQVICPIASTPSDQPAWKHPFGASCTSIEQRLLEPLASLIDSPHACDEIEIMLPAMASVPMPSPSLMHHVPSMAEFAEKLTEDGSTTQVLGRFALPAIRLAPCKIEQLLDGVIEQVAQQPDTQHTLAIGPSIEFCMTLARLARSMVCQQRFVPMVMQRGGQAVEGSWRPWFGDEPASSRVVALAQAMPPIVRAGINSCDHDAWAVTDEAMGTITDVLCRRALVDDGMIEAIETVSPDEDPQVAWLTGLLGEDAAIPQHNAFATELVRRVRVWIGGLDDRGISAAWKLCLVLEEPQGIDELDASQVDPADLSWRLGFELHAIDDDSLIVDASEVWLLGTDSIAMGGRRLDKPRELLLAELGRASKIFKELEKALRESEPKELRLDTTKAYQFLREISPLLLEQGFGVEVPEWWDKSATRLGARLRIESGPEHPENAGASTLDSKSSKLGLEALVRFAWDISVGDHVLSEEEFEKVAQAKAPLVRLGGKWVELRREDLQAAIKLVNQANEGDTTLGEALRMAYAAESRQHSLQVTGIEVSGWLSPLFDQAGANDQLEMVEPPEGFLGELRPYQIRGVSWMAFLERFGFGACLADDMGLGKTIQLLALLLHEQTVGIEERASKAGLGPTFLIVPMSVVGNWVREAKRFAPQLRVMVHHGVDRTSGDELLESVKQCDLFITTYTLANRDQESLSRVHWRRIVLDEAQYIKNPQAKQTQAIQAFVAPRRLALTGTPVENRLAELWSIMDFLNPGYLGSAGTFRRRFAVPIERYHDTEKADQLRQLVGPFILRRHKADPGIAVELPEKLESREYCHLTREQAALYEEYVNNMLKDVDSAQGMHRRGLVLASLIKLKQVCNHPSQVLKDYDHKSTTPPEISRSGKAIRLMEMLDEILASGEKALIFTQYRQMGHLLSSMVGHTFDKDILFLHGGVSQGKRVEMIDAFQSDNADHPVMILSLKAGGVGLNLTSATHVFHYDRWWNPAVENQATDRVYRIGQDKAVYVHKFVVRGTLEERIDEMIESKMQLADSVVGGGERWLTELSTDDLRSILTLRRDAYEAD